MRVCGRFLFQNGRFSFQSPLGAKRDIPKGDSLLSTGAGAFSGPGWAPLPGPHLSAFPSPHHRPVQDISGRPPRRSCLGFLPGQHSPGRGGLVEGNPVLVALPNVFGREVEPCLGPRPLAGCLGKQRTAGTNAFVDRVPVDLVPVGNVIDGPFPVINGEPPPLNAQHPLGAPAFAFCRFEAAQPSPSFTIKSVNLVNLTSSPKHLERLPPPKPDEKRRNGIARLGVRYCVSKIASRLEAIATHTTCMLHSGHIGKAPTSPHFADEGQSLLLTREELIALTGSRQPSRQRYWLDANGWPYTNAMGKSSYPRVARFVFVQKMQEKVSKATARQPRFDALDKFARLQ